MTNKLHRRRFQWLAVAVLLAALPAAAQDVPNVLVVVDTTEAPPYWNTYVLDINSAYSDVQAAINDAVTLSRQDNEPYTVLIVARNNSAPWPGGVEMPADANVRLLGEARPNGAASFPPGPLVLIRQRVAGVSIRGASRSRHQATGAHRGRGGDCQLCRSRRHTVGHRALHRCAPGALKRAVRGQGANRPDLTPPQRDA